MREQRSALVNEPAIVVNSRSVRGYHGSDLANVMGNSSPTAEAQRLAEDGSNELRKSGQ